jgi:hypothetical protein
MVFGVHDERVTLNGEGRLSQWKSVPIWSLSSLDGQIDRHTLSLRAYWALKRPSLKD